MPSFCRCFKGSVDTWNSSNCSRTTPLERLELLELLELLRHPRTHLLHDGVGYSMSAVKRVPGDVQTSSFQAPLKPLHHRKRQHAVGAPVGDEDRQVAAAGELFGPGVFIFRCFSG